MQEHWQSALSDMRTRLSEESFERWLAPIGWGGCDGAKLRLLVPNKFYADWIRTHYLDILLGLVRDKSGQRDVDVAWEVDEALGKRLADEERAARPERTASVTRTPAAPDVSTKTSGHPGSAELNAKYHFESFVVGPSNQFAYGAAINAATSPGARCNPLFIYGGVGLGKTHLVNAVGHRVAEAQRTARILYVSAEQFTNQFIGALQHHKMDEFRKLYRSQCDVLLIDDIQFLAGRDQTMEEFFHTFNALYHDDKQIVVSSDVPPQQMKKMEERLISRFQWGLVADVQAPELDTRIAILKKKAEQDHIELPDDVALYVAQTVHNNVRALEGALLRVVIKSELLKRPIDLALACETLGGIHPPRESTTTVDDIQRAVCDYFNIRLSDLKGHQRHRSISQPRMLAMYMCRQRLNTSYAELGDRFGGKDHTTVMSAVRKIEARILGQDAEVLTNVQAITRSLARS
ncbi:MAG: chromosomal replication initiator protein DnaA [Polyangiales bacterium]